MGSFIDRFFKKKGLPLYNNGVIPVNTGAILQSYDAQKYTNAYSENADVYAIVSFLARKCASIPFYVYQLNDGQKAKSSLLKYKQLTKGGLTNFETALIHRKNAYDDSMILEGTPLADLLNNPNSYQSQDAFFENLFGYRFLSGETFLWGNRGNIPNGKFVELLILPSQFTDIIPDPVDLYGILGYQLDNMGSTITLNKSDVMQWKSWNPNFNVSTREHMRGLSPIRAAWNNYLMGVEAQKSAASQMANGGAKGALVPKVVGNQIPMVTELQASQMQQAIANRINNNAKGGTVAMLQTPWEYLNFGLSNSEMQIIDTMKFSLEQWCRVFGMPVVLFSADNMSDNNYQNALRDLVTNTVVPMLGQLRDELNKWLIPNVGTGNEFIDFDVTALPELQKDIEKLVSQLVSAYWLTLDEKRIAMNYEPLGGEFAKAFINSGLTPIEDLNGDINGMINDYANGDNNGGTANDMGNGDASVS
jgi:HK97 family phage portal protein